MADTIGTSQRFKDFGPYEEPPDLATSLLSISTELSEAPSDIEIIPQPDRRLSEFIPQSQDDDTVAILRAFMDHLPIEGKCVIATYMVNSQDNVALSSLAEHLYTSVLAPMKACGGQTPAVTLSPLPRENIGDENVSADIGQSSIRRGLKNLRKLCIERDTYHCMITGLIDTQAPKRYPGVVFEHRRIAPTEPAHIIPFALGYHENIDIERDRSNVGFQERRYQQIWTTLFALFPAFKNTLRSGHINEPKNVITLWEGLSRQFGKLQFALEPTVEENTYSIILYAGFPGYYEVDLPPPNEHGDRLVRLMRSNGCDLPDPVLLEAHAAITKILHASGKVEEIDSIWRDKYKIKYLSPNGNTDIGRILSVLL